MVNLILFLMITVGLIVFCSKREHFLTMLLSLEYIMLSLFIYLSLMFNYSDMYFSLIFIVFTACEGALGLSILIMMSRSYGSDYFNSFNMMR